MTEQEIKEIGEQLAKQDAAPEVKPTELRDKQDFVELVVSAVAKKFEAINANREIKKLAPQMSDSKEVRDQKFKQLVKSILTNDREAYGNAA